MVLNQPYLLILILTAALLSCAINQINGLFYLRNVRGALKTSLALLPPPIYFPIFYRERAGLFSLSVTHSLIARVRIRNYKIILEYVITKLEEKNLSPAFLGRHSLMAGLRIPFQFLDISPIF